MSKQKEKSKPFDNSISGITFLNKICCQKEEIQCPDCPTNLIFMYARKRTEDEIWMCKTCETVLIVRAEVKIYIRLLKELKGKENGN